MACPNRPDRGLWRLAAAQHGVVTRAQLLDLCLTRSAILHGLRTRRLWSVHPGVYAVGRPELSREGVWLAAVLACGARAALSHLSAAELWEIVDRAPRQSHVSVPSGAGRAGPRGVRLHRAVTLRREEVTQRRGIPVTTLPRTLVDLAGVLDRPSLKRAVRQCERLHRLDLAELRPALDDAPRNAFRHARLRRVLDGYVAGTGRADSELEAAFLELCARHRLPPPETQAPIGPYRADFLWRAQRLVVETDGRQSHDGFVAFRDDRVKDRVLRAAGFVVLRFTFAEVVREPRTVAAEVARALTKGGSSTR
jgi:very-short-patch-repair endonuclease